MIADFQRIPNVVACQYFDDQIASRLDEMIGKWLSREPTIAEAHRQALQAANTEFHAYEEWICQQAPPDDDLPW
jgi:hypothetical protein